MNRLIAWFLSVVMICVSFPSIVCAESNSDSTIDYRNEAEDVIDLFCEEAEFVEDGLMETEEPEQKEDYQYAIVQEETISEDYVEVSDGEESLGEAAYLDGFGKDQFGKIDLNSDLELKDEVLGSEMGDIENSCSNSAVSDYLDQFYMIDSGLLDEVQDENSLNTLPLSTVKENFDVIWNYINENGEVDDSGRYLNYIHETSDGDQLIVFIVADDDQIVFYGHYISSSGSKMGCFMIVSRESPDVIPFVGEYNNSSSYAMDCMLFPSTYSDSKTYDFRDYMNAISDSLEETLGNLYNELLHIFLEIWDEDLQEELDLGLYNLGFEFFNPIDPTEIGLSGICGDNATWVLTGDGNNLILTIEGQGAMYDYSADLPAPWYQLRNNIHEIIIGEGITTIGKSAFSECSNLNEVTIADSVISLGSYAFSECSSLSKVVIPSGVTSIEQSLFYGCTGLTEIVIPNSVTSIGDFAFDLCSGLTSIKIPDRVTSIGQFAFYGCSKLESIVIPNGITSIERMTFEGCTKLSSVKLSKKTNTIGNRAFYGCSNLKGIEIPDSVKSIEGDAFNNCSGLTKVVIPKGVTSIGSNAFYNCKGLTVLRIPESVTSIDRMQLLSCSKLKDVYYTGTRVNWKALGVNLLSTTTLHIEDEILRLYGSNRYSTSLAIANRLKELNGGKKFNSIVLATGKDYPDALAGGYLASKKNAPIILIRDKAADNKMVTRWVQSNLKKGGTIYVLGSTAAVPDNWFKEMKSGFTVKRLGGKNRFGTDIEILKESGVKSGSKSFLVTTGYGYEDALCASALSYPLLIVNTKKNVLTNEQRTYLKNVRGSIFYIIGPTSVVSSSLEKELKSYGTVRRVSTNNSVITRSVQTAQKFIPKAKAAALAISTAYPDGLCGGVLANKLGAPLLLVKDGSETKAASFVKDGLIDYGIIYGSSKAAVSDKSVKKVFPDLYEIQTAEYK